VEADLVVRMPQLLPIELHLQDQVVPFPHLLLLLQVLQVLLVMLVVENQTNQLLSRLVVPLHLPLLLLEKIREQADDQRAKENIMK
jgi:hypothetical protein